MGIFSDLFKSESNYNFQKSYFAKTCSKCGCNLRIGGNAYHQDGKGGWECVAHIEIPPKKPPMFAPEGIKADFDGDVKLLNKGSSIRIKKYHLREPEQKIPEGFQIYDERLEVAGIQHRRDAAAQFVNQANQWLEFESEPLNSYDSNAIKILGCYQQNIEEIKLHVGYVPASVAKQITDFAADECKARLLKTYIGESGYVEILFQVLGPKERIQEYASFYVHTDEDDDEYDDEDD